MLGTPGTGPKRPVLYPECGTREDLVLTHACITGLTWSLKIVIVQRREHTGLIEYFPISSHPPPLPFKFDLAEREIQLLCNNFCRLLPDQQRSRVRILKKTSINPSLTWCKIVFDGRCQHLSGRWTSLVRMRQTRTHVAIPFHIPVTLRAVTPYTFRLASTTPPWSLGFIAQVPSYQDVMGSRSRWTSGINEKLTE